MYSYIRIYQDNIRFIKQFQTAISNDSQKYNHQQNKAYNYKSLKKYQTDTCIFNFTPEIIEGCEYYKY